MTIPIIQGYRFNNNIYYHADKDPIFPQNKINQFTLDLFNNAYKKLSDIVEYKERTCKDLLEISVISSAGMFYSLLNATKIMDVSYSFVLYPIGSVIAASAAFSFDLFYGKKAELFFKGANSVLKFYHCFEDFKEEPSEAKASDLFLCFKKMYKKECFKYVDSQDTLLFQAIGNFYLIDAVFEIFKESCIPLKLIYLNNRPCYLIGDESLDYYSYAAFKSYPMLFNSIEIAEKIMGDFTFIIEKASSQNEI